MKIRFLMKQRGRSWRLYPGYKLEQRLCCDEASSPAEIPGREAIGEEALQLSDVFTIVLL